MNNENKNSDEVITCVTFLVDDKDVDSVESTMVGLDTKPKIVDKKQQLKTVNIIAEAI